MQVDGREVHGKGEPFKLLVECGEREEVGIVVRVGFHSHYGEPPLDLPLTVHREIGEDMGGNTAMATGLDSFSVAFCLQLAMWLSPWSTAPSHKNGQLPGLTKVVNLWRSFHISFKQPKYRTSIQAAKV